MDLNDLETANKYSANLAYGNAKLENILFTAELNKIWEPMYADSYAQMKKMGFDGKAMLEFYRAEAKKLLAAG